MLLSLLIILKNILFINLTEVGLNKVSIFLMTTSISILILSIIYFSNSKYKKTIAYIFYALISILMFADIIYYGYFQALPSAIMLKRTKQLTAVGDSIAYLINFKNLLLILDLPITIYFIIKEKEIKESIKVHSKKIILLPVITILIISTAFTMNGKFQSIASQEFYTYHIADIVNTFTSNSLAQGEGLSPQDQEMIEELKERTNLEEGKLTGLGKDKNLIVLQIEALQNFVINLEYEGQEVTPNINKLIKNKSTVYYDDYHQLLGRGNTSDAEFVSNNSLHPSMEEPTYTQYEGNTFYGLPWLLRDNNYTAWAFHGYEKEFWNREKAYVNQGFQRFLSEEDYDFKETIGFGIRDEDFLPQTIDYLKELDSIDDNPFYAFIVTLTSHTPFEMPEKYEFLDIKEEHKGTILGNYLQSIHYTDKYIGEFIEDLKEEGLYDNSVIALYGDHFAISNSDPEVQELMGEFLGEFYNYDIIMNIPLVIHIPNEDINETISTIGSQIDFYPTILNIMGYKNDKGLMMGRDLTNYNGHNIVAPQTYMRRGSFIDENTIFNISRDGIFEHSSATHRTTKESVDIEKLRDIYDRVIREISISELILKNNLLKNYIENNGVIILEGEDNITINDKSFIKEFKGSTIEELNKEYDENNRFLSMYLKLEIIEEEEKEIKKILLDNPNSQIYMEDIKSWLTTKPNSYILIRDKGEAMEVLEQMKRHYLDLINRFIIEINDYGDYYFATQNRFKHIMFNVEEANYSDEQIIDLLKSSKFYGIILDEKRIESDLPKKIKELGVQVYRQGEEGLVQLENIVMD